MKTSSGAEAEWVVDPAKCVGCGDCAEICPVSVFAMLPAPCQTACPIHQDAAGYVALIKQGRSDEALASIKQVNPFPGITGRICTHPCETECKRGEIDTPIAICALKRFASGHGQEFVQRRCADAQMRDERVAIVGSGPTGLMAAHDLAARGYHATIFEALPVAGGLLSMAIPAYRLPREIIQTEIRQIEDLGVEITLNTTIGKDITLHELFHLGHAAILLATGAHKSLKLHIPGEDQFEGVIDAISFLREVSLGHGPKIAGIAAVIGGGNAAIDSARTLLRLGADEVAIIYRRTIEQMPAIESEVMEAKREGVQIHHLTAPTRVVGMNGRVAGLDCVRTKLGEPDASGRRTPIPIAGSEIHLDADLVVSAIGQRPDLAFLQGRPELTLSADGFIAVDTDTMATNKPGIFAAGDNVTGPATVIDALAAGRRAAASIDRYLGGEEVRQGMEDITGSTPEGEGVLWHKKIPKSERQPMPQLSIKERLLSFKEVDLGLTPSSAKKEAERCLQCAIFAHMDLDSCCGESCRICELHCWQSAIRAY